MISPNISFHSVFPICPSPNDPRTVHMVFVLRRETLEQLLSDWSRPMVISPMFHATMNQKAMDAIYVV